MEKIDLFKEFKSEYQATAKPGLVETAPAQYLAIEGQGEPGGDVFGECIGALYGMAYTIKMTRKGDGLGDYKVCKLEGLWHDPDPSSMPQEQWRWTLMIRTPECVEQNDVDQAAAALRSKGNGPRVGQIRLQTLDEGQCVQILHVGPYDQVCEPLGEMQSHAEDQGLDLAGLHHEIYLSDPRRVEPARLKTILRRPVKKAEDSV